ncbi:hypothetical protein E2C01_097704 [Portunus trituberculatus]|uniref:Uncharacterized protein n=1 Tax=Portunus trituberculatus TaxID=210409 RepID=A0A5B7KC33_PORTR|nr:hypothetical protein [Portunus trituberculatus]
MDSGLPSLFSLYPAWPNSAQPTHAPPQTCSSCIRTASPSSHAGDRSLLTDDTEPRGRHRHCLVW